MYYKLRVYIKKLIILLLGILLSIGLSACAKQNSLDEKNDNQINDNSKINDENIESNKENYFSYVDANNNLIYFKYSNLPGNLKGVRVWIERYENNENSEYNVVETYAGGNNISIVRTGQIKSQFTLLSDNYVEINVDIFMSSVVVKSYIDFTEFDIKEEKTIINRDSIKIDDKEFVLGMYILNDEEISIPIEIDNFESHIDKVLEENKIVFVLKGCFFE